MVSTQAILTRYKKLAFVETIIVLLLSLFVFTGWYFNISTLKRGISHSVSMHPFTALAFIMAIISFFCEVNNSPRIRLVGKASAIGVLGIGLTRIIEISFNIPHGITDSLFQSRLLTDRFSGIPNNMAPNTALCFLLSGGSLAFYQKKSCKRLILADWLAVLTALISFSSIMGYLYRGIQLYRLDGFIPMALFTAIAFFLLSTAILLYSSEFGIFRLILTPYDGSKMARMVLPFAIFIPVITGLLRAYGEDAGWFSSSSSVAMFTSANVILFIILIWQSTRSLNKTASELEEQRRQTKILNEQLLQEQTREFERTLIQTKLRQQNELIQATIEGQEKEKKQIGMELHDHINQILASTKLYLEMAKTDASMRMEIINKCAEHINFAISEIRNLSKSLVLHDAETGDILIGLKESIQNIERSSNIAIEVNICEYTMDQLNQKEQIAVYRIIQEQLNNVVKHSRATAAIIHMWTENGFIKLNIRDNGRGFNIDKQHRGIGLANINTRVESMSGKLQIFTSPGNGCELKIIIPQKNPSSESWQ